MPKSAATMDMCPAAGHNSSATVVGTDVTFSDYFQILQRFVWLVVIATIIGAGAAYAALRLPEPQYQAKFAVTLAPRTQDTGTYGNLIDALDRRSVPSTFAQVVMSPSVKDAVTSGAGGSGGGMTVKAVLVTDSNVIEATVTGGNAEDTRVYAGAVLEASSTSFARLYPLYAVTPLRRPTSAAAVPRHLATGLLLGGLGGAVLAYLLGLSIDANRRPRERDHIAPEQFAPEQFAPARISAGPVESPPPWKPRSKRTAAKS
jgi:capsular polysaccharide biosynthesis protein